uniref:Uncharacterized protein n=1 Tax=Phaeomonas parva TaxID=124430 RepID=A0A7S1XSA5_9STRA|mmetsp:Transcript_3258/g.9468  ORF Transcript_3258/g.9468 Transcript_3258/m.9468 type:complete len:247 (+) Transcript_3258:148-888(+)
MPSSKEAAKKAKLKGDRIEAAVKALKHEKLLRAVRKANARSEKRSAAARAPPMASILEEMSSVRRMHLEQRTGQTQRWLGTQEATLRALYAVNPQCQTHDEGWDDSIHIDPALSKKLWRKKTHEPEEYPEREEHEELTPWYPAASGRDFGPATITRRWSKKLLPQMNDRVDEIRDEFERIPAGSVSQCGLKARIGADLAEMEHAVEEAVELTRKGSQRRLAASMSRRALHAKTMESTMESTLESAM